MLTRDLERAYGGNESLNLCLGKQRCTLNCEGLGYVPKKGKNAFVTPKTKFIKESGKVCHKCKKVGHVRKNCLSNNDVSFVSYDSCYILTRNANGVRAKFVGTSIVGTKKNAIWVPKSLVANTQGPNKIWVPKRN